MRGAHRPRRCRPQQSPYIGNAGHMMDGCLRRSRSGLRASRRRVHSRPSSHRCISSISSTHWTMTRPASGGTSSLRAPRRVLMSMHRLMALSMVCGSHFSCEFRSSLSVLSRRSGARSGSRAESAWRVLGQSALDARARLADWDRGRGERGSRAYRRRRPGATGWRGRRESARVGTALGRAWRGCRLSLPGRRCGCGLVRTG